MSEDNEEIQNGTEEEYAEYWTNKGALKAMNTPEYQKISKEKERRFKMIVEMTIPWQRKLMAEIIDEIKSMENARSSIEMDNTLKLIYNEQK